MAKQNRTPEQEEALKAILAPVKKVDERIAKRDAKIVSMYPTFNENQIASMLMIPKAVVEQVLKDNE